MYKVKVAKSGQREVSWKSKKAREKTGKLNASLEPGEDIQTQQKTKKLRTRYLKSSDIKRVWKCVWGKPRDEEKEQAHYRRDE